MKILNLSLAIISLFILSFALSASEITDAIEKGDLQLVKQLVESNPALLESRDEQGVTPLHYVCSMKKEEIGEYLIAKGADVNALTKRGSTALFLAARAGSVKLVSLILDKDKTTLNRPCTWNSTPLIAASEYGRSGVVEILIKAGALIEKTNDFKRTPIIAAAREAGDIETIKMLLKYGADINARDNAGATALSLAAWRGFDELTNFLISKQAKIYDDQKMQMLGFAADKNLPQLFSYLKETGLDIARAKTEYPELVYATAAGGSIEIMKSLMEAGFDYKDHDRNGWTTLHYAASQGKQEMIKFLLEKGADKNAVNLKGETAYHLAIFREFPEAAELLKKEGVYSEKPKFPEIKGIYMGQTPPGDSPKMFLPGIVSGKYIPHCAVAFSPDGKEAYWTEMYPPRDQGYSIGGVMGMKEVNGKWTYPEKSKVMGGEPFFSPDGNRLFFISRNPINEGDKGGKENIWVMNKTATGWSEAEPLSAEINNNPIHWLFSIDKKNNIYFSDWNVIFRSEYENGKYKEAINLAEATGNPTLTGSCPFISPDGDYLLFAAPEKEGSSNIDLFISFRRTDGTWTEKKPVGNSINGSGHDLCPIVTPDGKYMFWVHFTDKDPFGIYWVSTSFIEKIKKEVM